MAKQLYRIQQLSRFLCSMLFTLAPLRTVVFFCNLVLRVLSPQQERVRRARAQVVRVPRGVGRVANFTCYLLLRMGGHYADRRHSCVPHASHQSAYLVALQWSHDLRLHSSATRGQADIRRPLEGRSRAKAVRGIGCGSCVVRGGME